jgi:hypothetical protein
METAPPPTPTSKPQPSIHDSKELLRAAFDLAATDDNRETYTVGSLIEDARFAKLSPILAQTFPRRQNRELIRGLLAATFDLRERCFKNKAGEVLRDEAAEAVRETERRLIERRKQGLQPDPNFCRDLHLGEFEAKRRFFSVTAFAESLGISRAAFYKAWKKQWPGLSPRKVFSRLKAVQSPETDWRERSTISRDEYSESD